MERQKLILPFNDLVVSAGYKVLPYFNQWKFHHFGLDCYGRNSQTIFACGSGTVVAVGQDGITLTGVQGRLGNCVVVVYDGEIEGNNGKIYKGLSSRMYHLAKINVKKGQKVTKDTILGVAGNTGRYSTGVHLHIEFDTDINYPCYAYGISSSGNIIKKGTMDTTVNPSDIWFVDYNQLIYPRPNTSDGWYNESDLNVPDLITIPDGYISKAEYNKIYSELLEQNGKLEAIKKIIK